MSETEQSKAAEISEKEDFASETEWDSDYSDDYPDHQDYELECRVEYAELPGRGHKLKDGSLSLNRGSNQQKFVSGRPKALVKYGQCDVPSKCDFDKETQSIINDTVEKYHYFASITGPILSRERSVILHCYGHKWTNEKPNEFLLKVYNLQFGMERIEKWTKTEHVSAWDMLRCGKSVNVPNVYAPTRNVIAMNFIGDDGKPAPSLKEVKFEITEKMYTDVITSMYNMYNHAKRVHGNMCVRNMLWWREKIYFVGLSRGVATTDPNAQQLLMKDCCHVTHFFKSKGLLKVKSIMNLFKFITGVEDPDSSVLLALKYNRRHVKNKQNKKKTSSTKLVNHT